MPVVDASVVVEYLAGGPHAEAASEAILRSDEAVWAPQLIDAEVGHVLRRAVFRHDISQRVGQEALAGLAEFPLLRVGHVSLLERAWELRRNLTFYDALYVALAELLGMPLLTLDAKIAETPRVRTQVRVVD